jgi:hypothetical protein
LIKDFVYFYALAGIRKRYETKNENKDKGIYPDAAGTLAT